MASKTEEQRQPLALEMDYLRTLGEKSQTPSRAKCKQNNQF
jgi:hypothetical protein